jgi:hypothetical protein
MTTRQIYSGIFEQSPSRAELKAARAQGRAPAAEIARLCMECGRPEFAAEAISTGMTIDQVRRVLAADVRPNATDRSPLDAALATAHTMSKQAVAEMWDRAFEAARTRH